MKRTLTDWRGCAKWLSACLKLGWKKEQLNALEGIWWKHHTRRATPPRPKPRDRKEK